MKFTNFLITFLTLLIIILLLTLKPNVDKTLISPLEAGQKVLGINQWFPQTVFASAKDAPKITAKGAIFIDTKDGKILYSKNPEDKLPIASLVKVMTVFIALEYKEMNDVYLISQRAADMEPDKMLLIAGERLTLKELLDGIFLVSANDAAEAIAEGTVENRDEFIRLMNEKAKLLGLNNTYFANPTGLDEDSENSYSTAHDLAILTRNLIKKYPEVVNISSTYHIQIPQTENHQDYDMYSGINLLTTYPGVVGFKTGFTPEAGYTLITLARKNEREVIGVLLGSEARRDEAKQLLDYSFKKLN